MLRSCTIYVSINGWARRGMSNSARRVSHFAEANMATSSSCSVDDCPGNDFLFAWTINNNRTMMSVGSCEVTTQDESSENGLLTATVFSPAAWRRARRDNAKKIIRYSTDVSAFEAVQSVTSSLELLRVVAKIRWTLHLDLDDSFHLAINRLTIFQWLYILESMQGNLSRKFTNSHWNCSASYLHELLAKLKPVLFWANL